MFHVVIQYAKLAALWPLKTHAHHNFNIFICKAEKKITHRQTDCTRIHWSISQMPAMAAIQPFCPHLIEVIVPKLFKPSPLPIRVQISLSLAGANTDTVTWNITCLPKCPLSLHLSEIVFCSQMATQRLYRLQA